MIRPADPGDYPSIAHLHNTHWPEHFRTPEDIARIDRQNPTWRFLLGVEGEAVGMMGIRDYGSHYELEVGVLPDFRGRGFGQRLYERALEELKGLPPKRTLAFVKESHPYALSFAQKRGWVETLRSYHHHLELPRFDPAPFEGLLRGLEAQGYRFQSYAESPNPERLYPLLRDTHLDIPRSAEGHELSLEVFQQRYVGNPGFYPEGSFIAVKAGEWVGLSLIRRRNEHSVHTNMTGILPEHRGKGLAVALKVLTILRARQDGFAEMHTNNAATNGPMLAVNARLGFIRAPAQIELTRETR